MLNLIKFWLKLYGQFSKNSVCNWIFQKNTLYLTSKGNSPKIRIPIFFSIIPYLVISNTITLQ